MAKRRTYREPARDVPVLDEWDVVVAGGGPAGCAAALAAPRHGAKTLLVEQYGDLGGATVSQLVVVVLSTNEVDFQGTWHEYMHGLKRRNGVTTRLRKIPGQIRGCVDPEMVKTTPRELDPMAVVAQLEKDRAAVEPALDLLTQVPIVPRPEFHPRST